MKTGCTKPNCNCIELEIKKQGTEFIKSYPCLKMNVSDFADDLKPTKEETVKQDLGICKEKNCTDPATKDYNGHQHYVCDYHYRRLNDEFDEEYR